MANSISAVRRSDPIAGGAGGIASTQVRSIPTT
jgi:hypothetical protein